MKLTIQSLESRETQQITTRNSCTLQSLKASIAKKFSLPSYSKYNLRLSLDGKTEITPASPQDLLSSLGIFSYDHIYYTVSPNGFSPKPSSKPQEEITSERGTEIAKICEFLHKVYNEEIGNKIVGDHMLLIVAIHAVFLELGFVCVDPVKQKMEGFCLAGLVSLRYTLPKLLENEEVETVDLKFGTLASIMFVNGKIIRSNVAMVKLCLEYVGCLLPSIKFLCAANGNSVGENSKPFHEKQVYEFWRIVKDGLALGLCIDLCQKTGLEPPPCFAILPGDLKLKIMEFLPGTAIAKMACACSELMRLSIDNDLWKKKCIEEFIVLGSVEENNWKQKFIEHREKTRWCRVPPNKLFHRLTPWMLYSTSNEHDSG